MAGKCILLGRPWHVARGTSHVARGTSHGHGPKQPFAPLYPSNAVMETLLNDVHYALRSLVKAPAFAAITVLTLALGIGANTAIFSVVNAVVLKPLPYPQPERLVFLYSQFPSLGFDRFWMSTPEFLEYRQ